MKTGSMEAVECPRCLKTITSPESHNIAEGTCKPIKLEMPCESDFILWCSMMNYNTAHAADIFRYIAQRIKIVK